MPCRTGLACNVCIEACGGFVEPRSHGTLCFSCFSCCYDRIPVKIKLPEEWLLLAHSLRVLPSVTVRKARDSSSSRCGSPSRRICCQETTVNASDQLTCNLCVCVVSCAGTAHWPGAWLADQHRQGSGCGPDTWEHYPLDFLPFPSFLYSAWTPGPSVGAWVSPILRQGGSLLNL